MDYFKSKYTTFPDNFTLDRRMAKGEPLEDIFDDTDYYSKCYSEDNERPITVRIGHKFNYVANNFLLFDNWFVSAHDFDKGNEYSYAYRRIGSNRVREGGVLIKRNGSYVTREEFLDITFCYGKYAIVEQYNGLFNVIDLTTGAKLDNVGLDVDCIAPNNYSYNSGMFIAAKGDIKNLHDLDWWGIVDGKDIAASKHIKVNFCSFNGGIISPNLWFDYTDGFQVLDTRWFLKVAPFAVVYLNNKANFIYTNGHLLSDTWFDFAVVYGAEYGIAGILKGLSVKHLPDYCNDNFDFYLNPEKYNLFYIDKYGRISEKQIKGVPSAPSGYR